MTRWTCGGAVLVTLLSLAWSAPSAAAGQWSVTDEGRCENRGSRDRERHCLALEGTFEATGALAVDGGLNGGVVVEGWSGPRVEVLAKVWADANDAVRAEEIADAVEIRMVRGKLSAEGPDTGRREGWGVSWEIRVPRATDLDIETHNGGIGVDGVDGRIRFEALNGGVRLVDVAGSVTGRTTNGGVHVALDGARWSGQGLDVETTNGGIDLTIPEGYSARIETGTVNGGIDIDFPVTIQGRIGRRLTTTLGEGGATIRAVTTNGGVKIRRGDRAIR
jgi:hypothetical protein